MIAQNSVMTVLSWNKMQQWVRIWLGWLSNGRSNTLKSREKEAAKPFSLSKCFSLRPTGFFIEAPGIARCITLRNQGSRQTTSLTLDSDFEKSKLSWMHRRQFRNSSTFHNDPTHLLDNKDVVFQSISSLSIAHLSKTVMWSTSTRSSSHVLFSSKSHREQEHRMPLADYVHLHAERKNKKG